MDENQQVVHQIQIKQALFEQRMEQMEKRQDAQELKVEEGFKAVDHRFDGIEDKLIQVLNKNPITDFAKENWKLVAFIGIILTYQPSMDMVKVLMHVLLGIQVG